MNTNTNNNQNTEKNNGSNNPRRWAEVQQNPVYLEAVRKAQALVDEAFFAAHPQPPLQSAAFWAQDAILNQFSVDQPDGDSENEDDEEYREDGENEDDEEYREEGEGEDGEGMSFNNHCSDVCSCIRYFETADPEPLAAATRVEVEEEEDFSNFFENCAYDSLLPPFSHAEFMTLDQALQVEEEEEEEDQSLYDRKRSGSYEAFVQKKVRKTFDEHDNIPMDISDDEEDLVPRQLFPDEEEDDDLLSIMSDLKMEDLEEDDLEEDLEGGFICRHGLDCTHQVCLDCVWYLEQEARAAKISLPELGPRQTTFWVDKETGEMVYNGNPNGSRFLNDEDEDEVEEDLEEDLEEDDEFEVNVVLENNFGAGGREITRCFSEEDEEVDLSDLPDLIDQSDDPEYNLPENQYLRDITELENGYGGGRYVYHPWQSARVETLKRAIAEFESGPNYK
jgi:hypothetical protein